MTATTAATTETATAATAIVTTEALIAQPTETAMNTQVNATEQRFLFKQISKIIF
jgi:hypothetical protein